MEYRAGRKCLEMREISINYHIEADQSDLLLLICPIKVLVKTATTIASMLMSLAAATGYKTQQPLLLWFCQSSLEQSPPTLTSLSAKDVN